MLRWVGDSVCLLTCVINCIFHLSYQVFEGTGQCNICNDGVYDTL